MAEKEMIINSITNFLKNNTYRTDSRLVSKTFSSKYTCENFRKDPLRKMFSLY